MPQVLSRRALNRATLHRQFLLSRAELPALEAIRHLYGIQAQAPNPPYIGLWTRLTGFGHEELARLLRERLVVRLALMRSTIHLVTAEDCLTLRPLLQPMLTRGLQSSHGKGLAGLDLQELSEAGRALVDERPLTFSELGRHLAQRWPEHAAADLVAAVRTTVPLVQVPPRGIWGVGGQPAHTSAQAWLGRPLNNRATPAQMIRRYLSAYGPATVMDIQQWSGMTRLSEITRDMDLRPFIAEDGAQLIDLPDAPLPGADTVAPVRYLSEFDNMLLSFSRQTRTRVMADPYRAKVFTVNGIIKATVLVDGFVRGIWKITAKRAEAVLQVELFEPVTPQERHALQQEGMRLLGFVAPSAKVHDVRLS